MNASILDTSDVVVVGAGVAGLTTAWELKQRGYNVVVVEQRFTAYGASGRNAGALWVQTRRGGIELDLARASIRKYKEYMEILGDSFEFRTNGGLFFIESEAQLPALEAMAADRRKHGLDVEILSQTATRQASRYIPKTAIGALYCAEDAQIDMVQFLSALASACLREGVRIYEHTAVLGTLRQGENVLGVRTLRGELQASGVVWATGAWAQNLTSEGITVPLSTNRSGQVLTQIIEPSPSPLLHGPRGVEGCGMFRDLGDIPLGRQESPERAMPLASQTPAQYDDVTVISAAGALYIGNTIEKGGSLNPHISLEATNTMVGMATERFPELASYGVRGLWAGLNSSTPDNLPIVDRIDGSYINVGHSWGVGSAPAAGEITADIISGVSNDLAPELAVTRDSLASSN